MIVVSPGLLPTSDGSPCSVLSVWARPGPSGVSPAREGSHVCTATKEAQPLLEDGPASCLGCRGWAVTARPWAR